jgi:hypothetical protein
LIVFFFIFYNYTDLNVICFDLQIFFYFTTVIRIMIFLDLININMFFFNEIVLKKKYFLKSQKELHLHILVDTVFGCLLFILSGRGVTKETP